jgi:DNA-binding winged helix-turn-helix (wHTH) protein/Tol biopolymer transport system component
VTGHKSCIFRFGNIEVRENEYALTRAGETVKVEPTAFRVLLYLLRNPGRLVTKDEILASVWHDAAVSDNSLTRSVATLRRLLDDSSREPRYIATVQTLGYRFLAEVTRWENDFGTEVVTGAPSTEVREGSDRHLPIRKRPDYTSAAELDAGVRGDDLRNSEEIELAAPSQFSGNEHAGANDRKELQIGRLRKAPSWVIVAAVVSCVLLPVAGWLVYRHASFHRKTIQGSPPAPLRTEQRITANSPEAPVRFAVVSPDGKYLAYSDLTGLYLRVIASGETRRWDVPKDFVAAPVSWFPDGTHLLVARFEGSTPSLWKLSLFGAAARKLIDNAGLASVSPDGTRIAFVTFPTNSGNELWVMAADGSNARKIAEPSRPDVPRNPDSSIVSFSWSPKGRRIACIERHWFGAFAPATETSTAWTSDQDGGDVHVILKDAFLGSALSWSPDGRILFTSRADTGAERDDEEVRSIQVDEDTGKVSGQPQLVTRGVGNIGGISITSDGKRLVLWRQSSHEQVFTSEFNSGTRKWKTPRRLTLDANGSIATAWLSDSRTVLFASNRNGTWTLYKQAIDEPTAEALVQGHSLYFPRLSADGAQVLYLSQTDPADPSRPKSLMRLPLAGGPPHLVLQDAGLANYQCARLPSTLCIVTEFKKDGAGLFSFDPERGIGPEILRLSAGIHDWTLSPDGKTLAVFRHDHRIHFFAIKDGVFKEDRTVTLDQWPIDNGDWNADGSGLLIPSLTPTGTPVILEVSRTGKAHLLLEGAVNTPFEFMLQAPDGRHAIVGAVVPGDNNAWLIDNY